MGRKYRSHFGFIHIAGDHHKIFSMVNNNNREALQITAGSIYQFLNATGFATIEKQDRIAEPGSRIMRISLPPPYSAPKFPPCCSNPVHRASNASCLGISPSRLDELIFYRSRAPEIGTLTRIK
jgi:hypothetical protein